ncbi:MULTISPECIES: hypothetical protein [unclassified Variovorax]|uniref:hypothetical protein n=1 Tax=unclassified Variovorax TaxID=663243 RepID=UPI0032E63491
MKALSVEILRMVDSSFPNWVECRLIDAQGDAHLFVEKAPIVVRAALVGDGCYPRSGEIACEVQSEWKDTANRSFVRIDTTRPDGVESIAGLSEFVIHASQLIDVP